MAFFFFEKMVNMVFSILYTRTTVTTQECRSFNHSLQKILLEGNCFKLIYVVDTPVKLDNVADGNGFMHIYVACIYLSTLLSIFCPFQK